MLNKPKHLTEFARANRKAGNPAETRLWLALKPMRAVGLAWRRQHLIAGNIVDFCCLRARVVVEIDGDSHDGKGEYDEERDADLQAQGFEVLHYTHSEALKDPEAIATWLRGYCTERARILYGANFAMRRNTSKQTLPQPLPEREGS